MFVCRRNICYSTDTLEFIIKFFTFINRPRKKSDLKQELLKGTGGMSVTKHHAIGGTLTAVAQGRGDHREIKGQAIYHTEVGGLPDDLVALQWRDADLVVDREVELWKAEPEVGGLDPNLEIDMTIIVLLKNDLRH